MISTVGGEINGAGEIAEGPDDDGGQEDDGGDFFQIVGTAFPDVHAGVAERGTAEGRELADIVLVTVLAEPRRMLHDQGKEDREDNAGKIEGNHDKSRVSREEGRDQ